MNRKRLLYFVNVDWVFVSHRLPIAEAAVKQGYEVYVLSKDTGFADEIKEKGIHFVNLPISRSGLNPIKEIILIVRLFAIYLKIKPTIVHHVTMKPVVYGSLVSKLLKIKTVNAISGLGYSFTDGRKGIVQHVMLFLMRLGFSNPHLNFIFQNTEDFEQLKRLQVVKEEQTIHFIKGVGVDLDAYKELTKNTTETVKLILPARMLWDKGVKEFVDAAKTLYPEFEGKARFVLYGKIDGDNPQTVPKNYLIQNQIPNFLIWEGHQDDNIKMYKDVDVVVLPSYREGMPKALLEACAAGIPIVTTDAIGCRDCVEEGKNGFKAPIKSVNELAIACQKLINSKTMREKMGVYAREKAALEFDQTEVIKKHVSIYHLLMHT